MRHLLLLSLSMLLLASDATLNLLNDLKRASEISTKTKLNISKTPAIISVLHAGELQKMGFTTIYEALEATPGIEISMGIGGGKQINMRGNKSIITDKLKFMIDGVGINAELSGANHFYLNMPLENIERIEIIRGPASALYGSFAHIGVVNVITKASTHKEGVVFLRGSSKGSSNLGFSQHINSEDIKVALLGSLELNEHSRAYENYSLLPGRYNSYENFTQRSLGAEIEIFKNISLSSKYLELDVENHFGYGTWPIVQDPKKLKHTSWINELRYRPKLSQTLSLDLRLGYKEYGFSGSSRVVPYSMFIPSSSDFIAGGAYKEKSLYCDLGAQYSYKAHRVSFGTYLAKTDVKNPIYKQNALPPILAPILSDERTIYIDGGALVDRIERRHYGIYLNDIITLSSDWIANIGVRYDDYSDADSAFSPKLALLYMVDERQSYKLMYQNSFRVPTFVEMYGTQKPFIGDRNLHSETIDTLEFAYSYQGAYDSWFNINFFYSKMQNSIYRDTDFRLKNGLDTMSYGGEIEFKRALLAGLSLEANYSYVHSKNEESKQTPLIANHLANAMLSYQISKSWHTGSRLRYVGTKSREEGDTREPLSGYTTLDQTLSYTHNAFVLRASVKNIFDADVRYIAAMGADMRHSDPSTQPSSGTYMDDLARNGRTFWLSVEWKFE